MSTRYDSWWWSTYYLRSNATSVSDWLQTGLYRHCIKKIKALIQSIYRRLYFITLVQTLPRNTIFNAYLCKLVMLPFMYLLVSSNIYRAAQLIYAHMRSGNSLPVNSVPLHADLFILWSFLWLCDCMNLYELQTMQIIFYLIIIATLFIVKIEY